MHRAKEGSRKIMGCKGRFLKDIGVYEKDMHSKKGDALKYLWTDSLRIPSSFENPSPFSCSLIIAVLHPISLHKLSFLTHNSKNHPYPLSLFSDLHPHISSSALTHNLHSPP
eukprot:Gb_37408 [translate_table: standard]